MQKRRDYMIFDAHCDIWTHVARKRLEGERDIMRNYHLNKFKESDINGGIFVVWVDPPYDKNPKYRTTQILSKIIEEILSISIVREEDSNIGMHYIANKKN